MITHQQGVQGFLGIQYQWEVLYSVAAWNGQKSDHVALLSTWAPGETEALEELREAYQRYEIHAIAPWDETICQNQFESAEYFPECEKTKSPDAHLCPTCQAIMDRDAAREAAWERKHG